MPCAALQKPKSINSGVTNNACGGKALTSVGGVDVTAQNLCPFHWQFVNGQAAFIAPIVKEP
jgi:hypothetical protein